MAKVPVDVDGWAGAAVAAADPPGVHSRVTVFSPWQTTLHLECPLKRILAAQEQWVPRKIEQRDISSILGVAIAAGLEHYNKGRPGAQERAMHHAQDLQRRTLQFRTLPEYHQSQWDSVPGRAEAALFAYTSLPDMLPGTIVAVEASYGPEGGYARPDLLLDDGRHYGVPLDYKTALSLGKTPSERERNRARRISKWADSHQMFHYAWLQGVHHYYIGFMVLEPEFTFEVIPFEIHPETLEMWERGARQTWADMADQDEGARVPYMAANHADEFGECPYKAACFTYHLDPSLMTAEYVRVPRE